VKFTRIPISFFPSTVFLIDDNKRFLKNISLQLDELSTYRPFDKPNVALEELDKHTNVLSSTQHFVDLDADNLLDGKHSTELDVTSIYKTVYNPSRFEQVSIVIVDYGMPHLNGLEFCKKLKNNSCKKIMLTGEADFQIAVRAFNDGIIDKFILKSDLKLRETLNTSIIEMQQEYFYESTQNITYSLPVETNRCLEDPKVVEIFNQIYLEHKFVECYLLDTSGSMLLVDSLGTPAWFIIKSEPELEIFHGFAEDDQLPEKVCTQIQSGELIPYFPERHTFTRDWAQHLYPAQKLAGRIPYYYSLLKKTKGEQLLEEQILSHRAYLTYLNNYDTLLQHV